MTQAAFDFEAPRTRARREDPATSKAAAGRVGEFQREHHRKILDALERIGTGTIYEIGAACGLDHVAVARRMKELEQYVERTAEERPSPKGRPCSVWKRRS